MTPALRALGLSCSSMSGGARISEGPARLHLLALEKEWGGGRTGEAAESVNHGRAADVAGDAADGGLDLVERQESAGWWRHHQRCAILNIVYHLRQCWRNRRATIPPHDSCRRDAARSRTRGRHRDGGTAAGRTPARSSIERPVVAQYRSADRRTIDRRGRKYREAARYYFGATGGGLWKTTDGGTAWQPVTDGQINSSSVGAAAVSASNPDVVYIGMGESELRGSVMQGDGVYRSADAGRTWRHSGLADTLTISRIRVHPSNPDLVYVAALGDPTQPSRARGVYRSSDGGTTWKQILFRDEQSGAVDLAIDPQNPSTIYATLWQVRRQPWQLWSGGPGSGLFKSTDGGDTWTDLTASPGMPAGPIGKIGIAIAGADPRRLFAVIEAKAGGLYRSDDAGARWTLVNGNRDLWQRSFYFNRIAADPRDRDLVYVLNFMLARSGDAGATYQLIEGSTSITTTSGSIRRTRCA